MEVLKKPKILFVEDDFLVREMFSEILSNYYEVALASNFQSAIDKILHNNSYKLLITDFDLKCGSNNDGCAIAEIFRSFFPDAPVIMATGTLVTHPRIQRFKNLSNSSIFEKPFDSYSLLKKLTELSNQFS